MADAKISDLTELAEAPAPADEFVLVDKSDTSEAASGTDKRLRFDRISPYDVGGRIVPTGATYQTLPRYVAVSVTSVLSTGAMRLNALWLPIGFTVTSISFATGTTGLTLGTSPHLWFALYDSSLGLLRQTTDDTAATWAASTLKTINLSSTYVTTYAGLHYLGIMCVCGAGGVMPSVVASAGVAAFVGLAPIGAGTSTGSLTTTAPNPAAAITASNAWNWAGVA